MNRREFLRYLNGLGLTLAFGAGIAGAEGFARKKGGALPPGMLVIDAHAHPDQFYYLGPPIVLDDSSTLAQIESLGMQGSSFAAVGDSSTQPFSLDRVIAQLDYVAGLESRGLVKIVRSRRDLPNAELRKREAPGAIVTLEGASPIGSDPATALLNLDYLHCRGVRMITLMHYLDNPFGEAMRRSHPGKEGTGLTPLGRQVIERMMSLGIVVDVAHAHYATLRDIAEIAKAHRLPVVDSHTSLSPLADPNGGRLRTWEEMEMIASTGGLVCTWPLKWVDPATGTGRLTLRDWAEENYQMMERLGGEHIGFGTDGGGILPERVDGYRSLLDIPALIDAMDEVGFLRWEIDLYMGRNLSRVLRKCIG